MTERLPTNRHRYLFGAGLSVLVHVAVALGFPAAPASESPAASEEPGLLWLETASGEGVAAALSASGDAALSAPAEATRSSARGTARASVATVPPAALTSEAPRESREATELAAASTESEGESPAGLATGGTSDSGGAVASAAPGIPAASGGTGSEGSAAGAPVRGPRLVSAANPCAGYFPAAAHAAHGRVQVEVEVGANGRIASTRVMAEQPLGEGFAGAARACADRLLFTPARTSEGTPVEGQARLLLSFDRS